MTKKKPDITGFFDGDIMNVIDIGSNSVRLLSNGKKTVITTRLAENMANGELDKKSITRTVEGIIALKNSVSGACYVFATEAVRAANNKQEFLDQVKHATGLTVDVISGDTEAEISFLGATNGYMGSAVVVDLGGASCEIIFGNNSKIQYKRSFPFGCVKLVNLFAKDYAAIEQHVKSQLSNLPCFDADKYVAVGGTATSLAAMAQNLTAYDPNRVHGYLLQKSDISQLMQELASGKEFATLSPMRKATVMQGATALKAILSCLNKTKIEISESDNLEGYAMRLM
ncbi:MAG: hypothetical protein IKC35_00680 [Clostridia bacterium]|nr:hypothetical protein [Clostridia bacterium]